MGSITNNLATLMQHGLQELAIDLSLATQESLLQYLALLIQWNKVYNLTAIRDPQTMVIKHLLDSLAVISYVPSGCILDVGSGAGLPAIPLALARPSLAVAALDSNHKKIRFITQVALALHITNLTIIQQRIENYAPQIRYDAIITRAFGSIVELITATRHLLIPGGVWLAMKGVYPDRELAELPSWCRLRQIIPLTIPYLGAERHLVILE